LITAVINQILKTNEPFNQDSNRDNNKIKWWRDPSIITNILLAVFTACLVGVGILQWITLNKTDKNLRVGERAFVYIDGDMDTAKSNDGAGDKWTFLLHAVNNGGTHTKSLSFYVTCEYGVKSETTPLNTSFLGPKQRIGMGSCSWPEDDVERLWNNNWSAKMSVGIFYVDAFADSHFTRVCRNIFIKSGPRNATTVQHEDGRCSESPDCTDQDCFVGVKDRRQAFQPLCSSDPALLWEGFAEVCVPNLGGDNSLKR
jgi:hypothetical protein